MSRYPSEDTARFDQQFAETEGERNERLATARKLKARANPIEYVEAQLTAIEKRCEHLHSEIRDLVKERNAIRAALLDLEFIFEGQEDIKDGPEGQQLPNDAMRAMTVIRAALNT